MKTKKVLLIPFAVILLAVFWFVWELFTDKPPQFFPLNNPHGQYKVIKSVRNIQGWDETLATVDPDSSDAMYFIEYRGEGVFDSANGKEVFFRVIVGSSGIDLGGYVGKDVLITRGGFVESSTQCIQSKCVDIGGPWVALKIDALAPLED